MDDRRIEQAIEDVAREMTAGEPNAAFRARIIDRIDAPRPTWRSPWVWSPIAAAALIVVAMFVARSGEPRGPREAAPQPALPAVAQAPPPAVAAPSVAPALSPAEPRDRGITKSGSPQSEVAALAPPPLRVPPIALRDLGPADSIQLPELPVIEPIALAPIDEKGERP